MSNLHKLRVLVGLAFLVGVAAAQESLALVAPLPGGENAGGGGVWILPRVANYMTPHLASGQLQVKDAAGSVVDATGYSWVRWDNHLVLFLGTTFVAADMDFFVSSVNGGTVMDSNFQVIGTWTRAQ